MLVKDFAVRGCIYEVSVPSYGIFEVLELFLDSSDVFEYHLRKFGYGDWMFCFGSPISDTGEADVESIAADFAFAYEEKNYSED